MKTILLVVAHPDDESFIMGGTITKYATLGWSIHCIVATNGEKGANGTFVWANDEALGQIRQKEMQSATHVLGIHHVQFLNKPDGDLSSLSPGTLEDPIVKKMEELLPDIVITYDTTGITNDPDNIKVSLATTFAFQKYAKHLEELKHPDVAKGRGKEWREEEYTRTFSEVAADAKEPKLYYACIPEHVANYMKSQQLLPESAFDKPILGMKDKFVTTVIDITNEIVTKGKALLQYETQKEEVDRFIDFENHPLHKEEYFMLRMQGIYEVFMGKNDRIADSL